MIKVVLYNLLNTLRYTISYCKRGNISINVEQKVCMYIVKLLNECIKYNSKLNIKTICAIYFYFLFLKKTNI